MPVSRWECLARGGISGNYVNNPCEHEKSWGGQLNFTVGAQGNIGFEIGLSHDFWWGEYSVGAEVMGKIGTEGEGHARIADVGGSPRLEGEWSANAFIGFNVNVIFFSFDYQYDFLHGSWPIDTPMNWLKAVE